MDNKKSIFEKLGLVERADDKKEDSISDQTSEQNDKPQIDKIVKKSDDEQIVNISLKQKNNDAAASGKIENEENSSLENFLSVKEVYSKYNLIDDKTKMIYILDNFMKALPDNLPVDVKRQSVLNIAAASGINIDKLLEDGNKRLEVLDMHLNNFTDFTSKITSEKEHQINKLMKQIENYKEAINLRKKLQSEQKSTIEFEKEKITNIINFIKYNKN